MVYKIGEIIFTLSVMGLIALIISVMTTILKNSNNGCVITVVIAIITISFFIIGAKILSNPKYEFEYLESQKVLADKNLQEFLDKHKEFK